MSGMSIGSLEETILLIVLVMPGKAYGVSITEEYQNRLNKSISIPAVHTVLRRLEKKGFLSSKMGGATTERGGRKKRIFEITKAGYKILSDLKETRDTLWQMAPKFSAS